MENSTEQCENNSIVESATDSPINCGIICLSFPQNECPEFEERTEFPHSYAALNDKEKLMLLFVENFRRQFFVLYPQRKPCVLAVRNECYVQKFVCTTIRPTAFLYSELIGSWEENAKFVADFISFEPLPNPIEMAFIGKIILCLDKLAVCFCELKANGCGRHIDPQGPLVRPNPAFPIPRRPKGPSHIWWKRCGGICQPTRLISPDTLLKRRKGNSFEIATLLCSLLIGNGFDAMIVCGYATREVVNNDQKLVSCPYIPDLDEKKITKPEETPNTYVLRDPPDLRSKFLLELDRRKSTKAAMKMKKIYEDEQVKIKNLEKPPFDNYYGKRVHAWIVVILKKHISPPQASSDDDTEHQADESNNEKSSKAFYIEPSTGFKINASESKYFHIESVWNDQNYYINLQQNIIDIDSMEWDFKNPDKWEQLLSQHTQEIETDQQPKQLDIPSTWVEQLSVSKTEYEERYPNAEKLIHFKRAIYERFAPYNMKNGLLTRLTVYETLDYKNPITRWEWYRNREDLLNIIKVDFSKNVIQEHMQKGRSDFLKEYSYNFQKEKKQKLTFFHIPRLDCLKKLEVDPLYIREQFDGRIDKLYDRIYKISEQTNKNRVNDTKLVEIVEKFHRSLTKPANTDISIRKFMLQENKIILKFHYAKDAITATTRIYRKPPNPDYGCEIKFFPEDSITYISNPLETRASQLEQYLELLDQLNAEENCKQLCHSTTAHFQQIFDSRKNQMENSKLSVSIFDPLRNEATRKLRLLKQEMLKEKAELALKSDADFLAPHLLLYTKKKPNFEESANIYKKCLDEIKTNFAIEINDLKARYEEYGNEILCFRKFLAKYQDQFTDEDYEGLIKEGEQIEFNKRIIHQRLVKTEQESITKYNALQNSVKHDKRLNFHPTFKF